MDCYNFKGLKSEVANSGLEEVLECLMKIRKDRIENQVIIAKIQHKLIRNRFLSGIITYEVMDVEEHRIICLVLSIIDELIKEEEEDKKQKNSTNPYFIYSTSESIIIEYSPISRRSGSSVSRRSGSSVSRRFGSSASVIVEKPFKRNTSRKKVISLMSKKVTSYAIDKKLGRLHDLLNKNGYPSM